MRESPKARERRFPQQCEQKRCAQRTLLRCENSYHHLSRNSNPTSALTSPKLDLAQLSGLVGTDFDSQRNNFIDRQAGARRMFATNFSAWRLKFAERMLAICCYVTANPLHP